MVELAGPPAIAKPRLSHLPLIYKRPPLLASPSLFHSLAAATTTAAVCWRQSSSPLTSTLNSFSSISLRCSSATRSAWVVVADEDATSLAATGAFTEILEGDVYKYYADGEWRTSASGKSISIINPTTRKTQYKVQATS